MKTHLTSSISALVLILAKFYLTAASPIPVASAGLGPLEPLNPEIPLAGSDNSTSAPVVEQNGEILRWKGKVNVPGPFIPDGTKLELLIPDNDAGLDSVFNIIALMRTAVQVPTSTGKSTARWLGRWINSLRKSPLFAKKEIPRSGGAIWRGIVRLTGKDLEERKELIKEVVEQHNKGRWFKPSKEMKRDFEKAVYRPRVLPHGGLSREGHSSTMPRNPLIFSHPPHSNPVHIPPLITKSVSAPILASQSEHVTLKIDNSSDASMGAPHASLGGQHNKYSDVNTGTVSDPNQRPLDDADTGAYPTVPTHYHPHHRTDVPPATNLGIVQDGLHWQGSGLSAIPASNMVVPLTMHWQDGQNGHHGAPMKVPTHNPHDTHLMSSGSYLAPPFLNTPALHYPPEPQYMNGPFMPMYQASSLTDMGVALTSQNGLQGHNSRSTHNYETFDNEPACPHCTNVISPDKGWKNVEHRQD